LELGNDLFQKVKVFCTLSLGSNLFFKQQNYIKDNADQPMDIGDNKGEVGR
jgi:hypothetical protein